jgi:hypothetical protein
LFLRLLQVPFSQSVAAHFPPPRLEEAVAPTTLNIASLPDYLRERIARAAAVPVADVKQEHITQMIKLSLSATPITNAELRHLADAHSLETLYLSGCTALRSTEGLPHLPALKWLSLMDCTGLKGAAALDGLTGLDQLEVLDLRGCTGLNKPALASLRQMIQTSCIIIGPNGRPVKHNGLAVAARRERTTAGDTRSVSA